MTLSIGRCNECPWWFPFFLGDGWEHLYRAHGETMPPREVFRENMARLNSPSIELMTQAVNLGKAKALKQYRDNSQAPDLDAFEVVKERARGEEVG